MADPKRSDDWIRTAVRRYEQPLVRYAAHLLGDVDRARDAAQEAFLRLCRADRSEVESHLAPWLFRVCRNLALDVKRKEARMRPMAPDPERGDALLATDPGDAVLRRESRDRLVRALDDLPPRQQEILRLKFREGLSYREIGRVMGLSVSNVGYLIHMAVTRLRKTVAADATSAREASS